MAWDLSYGPMGLGFDSFRVGGFLVGGVGPRPNPYYASMQCGV